MASTTNVQTQDSSPAPVVAPERAIEILREALEQQSLCDPGLDVESAIAFAISHPDESIVDSFAAVEVICSLDEVFGAAIPRELLNHDSLTTLQGLRNCVKILESQPPNAK
jgi:acyl carrier protein